MYTHHTQMLGYGLHQCISNINMNEMIRNKGRLDSASQPPTSILSDTG